MGSVLFGVGTYVIVQLAIAVWVSRSIKTEADYINAGRRIGPVVGAFTVFATWFGAEAIVGTAGQVYERGLAGGETDPFGYALALVIAGLVFAAQLWRRGLTTFADFFRQRFSAGVEKLVVLVLLPGSVFWAAAQIRAFGQVVSAVSDVDVSAAILAAAFFVVVYTVLGGLLADAITDFLQGVSVIAGLAVLFYLSASSLGGLSESLASVPVDRLVLFSPSNQSLLAFAETLMVPICGTIVAVELISRMLGCRSARAARQATVSGGVLYAVVGLIPVYLGLVGPNLIPGLSGAEAEQIVPQLASQLMPGVLYILFAGALISAILSTVDSVLLAASAHVSHNIVMRLALAPSDGAKLLAVRLTVVALAVVACGLALAAESIRELIEVAAAIGSSGVFVSLLFGLYSNYGGKESAYAAIITGGLVWLVGYSTEFTDAPLIVSIAAAVPAYVLAAPLRRVARAGISSGNSG